MNNIRQIYIYNEKTLLEFNLIIGNRDFKDSQALKIKKSYKNKEILPPIFVDLSTNQIIDDQHRYYACQELKKNNIPFELDVIIIQIL